MYPYNHEKEFSMLKKDYALVFLNLEDVIITNVENISDQLHISIELPHRKHLCPCCGAVINRVHDYRMQLIKDTPSSACVSVVIAATVASDYFLSTSLLQRYKPPCG